MPSRSGCSSAPDGGTSPRPLGVRTHQIIINKMLDKLDPDRQHVVRGASCQGCQKIAESDRQRGSVAALAVNTVLVLDTPQLDVNAHHKGKLNADSLYNAVNLSSIMPLSFSTATPLLSCFSRSHHRVDAQRCSSLMLMWILKNLRKLLSQSVIGARCQAYFMGARRPLPHRDGSEQPNSCTCRSLTPHR